MAASDELAKLTARAKEAEDHVAAARGKAKTELENDMASARASSDERAARLRETVDAGDRNISSWWSDVERNWSEHIATIRDHIDRRKAQRDAADAERTAENAEDDAWFAIDYAYGAIEEAEYAVLDARLARMDADELAGKATTGA